MQEHLSILVTRWAAAREKPVRDGRFWPALASLVLEYASACPSVLAPELRPKLLRRNGSEFSERALVSLTFDDFGHGHAKPVFDDDNFAARNQSVININVDGFPDLAVEFDHGTTP